MAHTAIIGTGEQDGTKSERRNMSDESKASSKVTRKDGKNIRPELSVRDEMAILEAQALDVARAAGVVAQWAVLHPSGELVLVLPGGHLCHDCGRPFFGEACWHCEAEK
jgi:hypothetical protein